MKFSEMFGQSKGFTDSLIGFFIGLLITVIVAVNVVIPTIADQTQALDNNANVSDTTITLLDLVPLFVALAILVLVVSLMRF